MYGFCCNRNIYNGRVWRFDMLRKRCTRIVVSSHAKKESKFVLFTFLLCLSLGSPLSSVFRSSLTTFSFSCSSSGWLVLSVFALAVFWAVSASFNRSSSSSRKAWSLLVMTCRCGVSSSFSTLFSVSTVFLFFCFVKAARIFRRRSFCSSSSCLYFSKVKVEAVGDDSDA